MTNEFAVVLSQDAVQDLADIWNFIALDNPVAADGVVAGLLRSLDLLSSTPKMGRPESRFGRQARLFVHGNYLVIYRIGGDEVEVSRIADGRRDLSKIKVTKPDAAR
ncbi:MAG: type II toxin-antitoxin system RelE/ParE family toxin [Rhodospirillaceae bacterium]|nr:type II toxin-antitoxin system RelE/ParE family toxin [Rhodospirillaceae bacterium]